PSRSQHSPLIRVCATLIYLDPAPFLARETRVPLNLIGAVAGDSSLVRVGLSSGRARLDSRNVCLRGGHAFFFGLAGFIQLVAEFVLGFLKFAHCLSHSTRQFRQFFCPEEDEDN